MRLWTASNKVEPVEDLSKRDRDVETLKIASPPLRIDQHSTPKAKSWLFDIDAAAVMAEHLYSIAVRKEWTDPYEHDECVVMRKPASENFIVRPLDASSTEGLQWASKLRCEAMLFLRSDLVVKTFRRIAPMNNWLRLADGRFIKIVDSIFDIEEERGACQDGFLLCRKLAAAVVWSTNPQSMIACCKACEMDLAALLWPSSTEKLTSYHLGEVKPKSAVVEIRELSSLEILKDIESQRSHARPAAMVWPLIVAIALVLVALFFLSIIVVGCFQLAGPIHQLKTNSRYYSGKRPQTPILPTELPHITVQCPIYKEGLWDVIDPTMQTVKQAIAYYQSQGGTASIVVNDDGMQILDEEGQRARRQYYHLHNIGWTARPANCQNDYIRVGAFKKASNMNYGMRASKEIEDVFEDLLQDGYSQDFDTYGLAVARVVERQPGLWCEGDVSLGELILLVDADTRVPEACFLDAAKEFHESPELGILQYPSDVLIVSDHNFWEMAMAHFTRSNYFGTRYVVASGDATPFFGHNAFLRWSAVDSIANTHSGKRQWWSENHVSEDFEMSLKLQTSGYITRMAGYSLNGFQEGVSLTVFDEISRWEKYAFGVSELIFNPFWLWFRKGPFTPLFRQYVAAPIDLAAKCSALIYMGTYFGIGLAWIFAVANYFLLGWVPYRIRGYYTDSLQILTAVCVVFGLKDAFVGPFVRYRVKEVTLYRGLLDSLKYFAITTIFLQGISMHVSRCLVLHLFGRKITWESTSKSLEETSLQSDLPMIWRRFKTMYIVLLIMLCIVIVLGFAVPENWRITSFGAVFPLAWMICWHTAVPLLMHNRSILNEIFH